MASEPMAALEPGQPVVLQQNGLLGIVRFVGTTSFAAGDWVGVELDTKDGKNDGSVQGRRYFHCLMGHGMFVRPNAIAVIDQSDSDGGEDLDSLGHGQAARKSSIDSVGSRDSRASMLSRSGRMPNGSGRASMNGPDLKRQSLGIKPPGAQKASMNGRRQSNVSGSPTPAPRLQNNGRGVVSPTRPTNRPSATPTVVSVAGIKPAPRFSNGLNGPQRTAMGAKAAGSAPKRTSMGPPSLAKPNSRQSLLGPKPAVLAADYIRSSQVSGLRKISDRSSTAPQPISRPPMRNSRPEAVIATESASTITEPSDDQAGRTEHALEGAVVGPSSAPAQSPQPSTASEAPSAVVGARHLARPSFGSKGRSSPTPSMRSSAAAQRENEDLKTKLRMMEKRRMEDREKLMGMERVQQEKDRFESIIHKLQAKLQPLQLEIAGLKKQLKEAETKTEQGADQQGEHESMLELATLDKEMAEEQAEALKSEVDVLKLRVEELQLEVEVLRDDNEELNRDTSTEERTSQGWLQLERQNDRLREALIALRDVAQRTEAELRSQLRETEQDNDALNNIKGLYESSEEKLRTAEDNVEELRGQLDAALGAQDIIEELSAQNGHLESQIIELKTAVEDLESLKELNDELEYNHIETEKQLEEEIRQKDALLGEQYRQANQQNDALVDYEYTIAKFRQLVRDLQTEIDKSRSDRENSEAAVLELNERSKAMMQVNMSLQTSAAKAQLKGLELNLERLEAQQVKELLAMSTPFMMDGFESEREPMEALQKLRRIEAKSKLVRQSVHHRVTNRAMGGSEAVLVSQCQSMHALAELEVRCRRLIGFATSCQPVQFLQFAGVSYDLEPLERILDQAVSLLRTDSLQESDMVSDLGRALRVLEHLTETHLRAEQDGPQLGASQLSSRLLQADDQLDVLDLLLLQTIVVVSRHYSECQAGARVYGDHHDEEYDDEDEDDEEDNDLLRFWSQKVEEVRTLTRGCLAASQKSLGSMQEFQSRSMVIDPGQLQNDPTESLELLSTASSHLFSFAQALLETISDSSASLTSDDLSASFIHLKAAYAPLKALSAAFDTLSKVSSSTRCYMEFEPPSDSLTPWAIGAQALKSAAKATPSASAALEATRNQLQATKQASEHMRRETEEQRLKIEVLEGKMADVGRWRTRVMELERNSEELGKERKRLAKENEAGVELLADLERELQDTRAQLRHLSELADSGTGHSAQGGSAGLASGVEMSRSAKLEIRVAQARIRELEATVQWLGPRSIAGSAAPSHTSPYGRLRDQATCLSEPLGRQKPPARVAVAQLEREGRSALCSLLLVVSNQCDDMSTFRLPDLLPEQPPNEAPSSAQPKMQRSKFQPLKERLGYRTACREEQYEDWVRSSARLLQRGQRLLDSGQARRTALTSSRLVKGFGVDGHVRIASSTAEDRDELFEESVEYFS